MTDKARNELAQDLQGSDGKKGKAGKAATQGQKKPNSPAGGGASEKDKNKAVECIKDAWKKSLRAMQASAVAEHSTANDLEDAEVKAYNQKNSPKVNSISEMPPAQRKAASSPWWKSRPRAGRGPGLGCPQLNA